MLYVPFCYMCEIAHYIHIPEELHERIHNIVKVRVKDAYENNAHDWENYKNNWVPVCAGRVGMMYLYEFPEDFPKVKDRILSGMREYIANFEDDGICSEGIGYWGFGFGSYLFFAEMLKRVEGTDILKDEKIKAIAKFQQHMFVKNDITASFSDCSNRKITYGVGLMHFMKKKFGDEIKVPPKKYIGQICNSYDWASVFRNFYWYDAEIESDDSYFTEEKEQFFGNAQWYINRKNKFALMAKGGNNEELHNHNDVGSFIITDGEHQLISDFGAGEYTKGYFTADERYNLFCCSSEGHSVPIIDGKYQMHGRQYSANVEKATDDCFCLEMGRAYDIDELTGLRRCFNIKDNSVTLCDSFNFKNDSHEVVERFISMVEPKKESQYVKIGDMNIKSSCEADISQTDITGHHGEKVTLYIIDYRLKSNEFKVEFVLER